MMGKDSLNNDASKKSKKTKKVKLLRNPFADSFLSDSHRREGKDLNFSNPFLDSKGLLLKEDGSDGGHNDDNDDGEEDEERVVQARRETLAALDPKNKNASKHAEFKSLKVRQPILQDEQGYYQQQQDEQAQEQAPDQHINQGPFSDIRPPETIPVPAPASIIIETPPLSTRHSRPPTSDHKHNASFSSIADIDQSNSSPGHNVTNSLLSTPKRVPEIAICQATPSPPSSGRHHHRGSSLASIVQHNSTLLSTNYTPSPLSLWADDDFGSAAKVPSNRSTVIYKNTFQRVGSASITVSPLPLESRIQGGDHDVLPDHIGVEIEKKSKLSFEEPQVKRNTFGQTGDNKPRRSGSQKKRGKRNTGHLSSLDPWDSCDDMLAPRCSDDEDEDRYNRVGGGGLVGSFFGGSGVAYDEISSFLKGKVGGRRRSSDDQTGELVPRQGRIGRIGALANNARDSTETDPVEDWIMHPRTAAIRDTFHKAHDVVPVPNKPPRPVSFSADYTTISLASPSMYRYSSQTIESLPPAAGGASLSRAGSLDSSFHRLKKGASSLLMGLGSVSLGRDIDTCNRDEDQRMQRMMNGGFSSPPLPRASMSEQRASSMTRDSRNSTQSPVFAFSSLPSFQTLLTTGLNRSSTLPSSSYSENISPPPFSPTAYLRRSQTTIARDSLISFSPPKSRRKNTPAMIPTIVIPDQCDEISSTAQSATTVSCSEDSLNSASSSTTMITDDGQQGSPTFSLRSVAPRTFQRLVPVQQGERLLLKVPENDGKSPTRHTMTAPPTSLAAAAMAAAQRAHSPSLTFGSPGDLNRSESSGSAKSMTRPLTGDDYIGQFERERASSRRVGFGSVMASSSSTLASSSYLRHDPLSDMATAPAAKAGSLSASFYGSNRSMISTGHDSQDHLYDLKSEQDFQDDKDRDQRRSFFSKMFSFYSGSGAESSSQSAQAARALAAHHHLRERQDSNNSDISEKLMHLPEPSPFEGMCSCRGVVNITSMTLILCGLILLILGYPIAASIKKERLAAEAEAAAAAAAVADSATGSSSRLSSSSIVGAGVKFTSPESAAMGTPNATVANVSPNGTDVLNTTTTTTTKPADTTNGQRRVIQVKFAMMDKNKHATGFLFNKDFYNKTV